FWRVASVNSLRLAATPGDAPQGLLRARGIRGGVGKLAGGILAFPSDVNDGLTIVREIQFRERLSIVLKVRGEPARGKRRTFRSPNVALPFLIERPGDAIGRLGGRQILRKRRP